MSKQNTEMMGHSTNRYTNPIMHWYKQRFKHVVRERFEQGFEYKPEKKLEKIIAYSLAYIVA